MCQHFILRIIIEYAKHPVKGIIIYTKIMNMPLKTYSFYHYISQIFIIANRYFNKNL